MFETKITSWKNYLGVYGLNAEHDSPDQVIPFSASK